MWYNFLWGYGEILKGSIEDAEAIAEGYFKGSFEGKKNPEKARKWASYAAKHGSRKAAEILTALV